MESKEANVLANKIVSVANEELYQFYRKIKEDVALTKAKGQKVTDRSKVATPACPTLEPILENPIGETERQTGMSVVKELTDYIKKNADDFQGVDISERGDDKGSKDSGSEIGKDTKIVNVGSPKWIQELENSVKSKLERVTRREYFDVEGLTRGLTRRKKEKGSKRKDYVYFLLDVSGSMDGFSYRGINLKALLASYVPAIAKKFKGKWIQVDGRRVIPHELSDMSKGEIKSLILGGGSGASFDEAIEYVKDDIIKSNVTNPIVIMASDAHEDFNFELLLNTIFLTTDEGWDYSKRSDNGLIRQGFPNVNKGQKVILIDIDTK
jgi:hypothetical protein